MLARALSLLGILVLASCAYMQDRSIQNVTVVTPGAYNAICYMYVEGLRYRVRPPQTVNISKSSEDLILDCFAPGNKHHKVVIKAEISNKIYRNVTNGVLPGLSWDYFSGSIYKYPERVVVDFTNTPVSPEAMPAQNQPDIKQPEEYPLEEYLPGTPRLNSDRLNPPQEIRRREKPDSASPSSSTDTDSKYMVEPEGATPSSGKGDLKKVIDGLKEDINPAKPASPPAGKPGPAYPGQ